MALPSASSRNDYLGNNTTPTYSYTFRIFQDSDLLVVEKDTDDVETTLVLGVDYTVTGVGDLSGGDVTLTAGNLATGNTLTIRRNVPLVQNTDIRNQGDFFPEVHEDQFDKDVMMAQQQQDEIDRCLQLPESITKSGPDVSTTFDPSIPTDVTTPDRIFGVNETGDAIKMLTPAEIIALSGSLAPGNNLNDVADKNESRNNLHELATPAIANNQAAPADLTGISLTEADFKSGIYLAQWFRDATTDLVAWEVFSMDRNPGSGTWTIRRGIAWGDLDSVANKPGGILALSVSVAAGVAQAQYTSSNESGGVSSNASIFTLFKVSV